MKAIAIALVIGSLTACATDESTQPIGGGAGVAGKPSTLEFAQPERGYAGGSWSETLPELPGVVLLHEGARVAVLAEDGTELCSLVHHTGEALGAAEIIDACGELQR